MHTHANWQKLLKAIKDVMEPSKKARAIEIDEIVMEGPACLIPSAIRWLGDLENGI